jgi:PucR C-terminal helix-turn-helix domain/GGDEF-like domain
MERDSPVRDAEYLMGLREAVSRGVDYAIEILASREPSGRQVPVPLITQARLAARQGIGMDVVLRRYLAARMLLNHFLLEEAARIDLHDPLVIQDVSAAHETAFNNILTMATKEYEQEVEIASASPDSRLTQRVQRLLAGESVGTTLLDYDLELNHLGLVALSPDAKPHIRRLAKQIGGHTLSVAISNEEIWAWIGTVGSVDPLEVSDWAKDQWPASVPLGIGEPAEAPSGWRRSHTQAKAASGIAARSSAGATLYRDVVLLASASSDPLLLAAMRDLYLRPLGPADQQGVTLRKTLRVYFDADRNSSSAAAALGVSRQTVTNRLRNAEERLHKPVNECGDLLQAAIHLEDLQLIAAE